MTLLRLAGFAEYWKEAPPVCEIAAAWVGVQGGGSAPPPDEGMPDLLDLFPRKG